MTTPRREKRGFQVRSVTALLVMSLVISLVGAAITVASAPAAAAAVPGAAPANPTTPCTWNWNRWSRPGGFSFPYVDSSYDPTQAVFSQAASALGANGWYEASSAPQFSYSGLREGTGPAEATTGANDQEWSYGVGYYIMAPGSRQNITISDGGRQDSHAFAFFDSSGNQFGRFPRMADVNRGVHYVASEQEANSDPASAGGLSRGNAWSTTVGFTVPADGIVYIHYLNFDERIRTQFATFSGACGPVAVSDSSTGNLPGSTASIDVAANDTNINARTISIVGADAASGALLVEGQGTWAVAGQGVITFTPDPGFVGDPRPISYTASNNQGKVSRAAQVSVAYLPTFSAGDTSDGNKTGEPVTIRVIANDSNVNARTLQIVGADASGGLIDTGRGTWSVDRSSGSITFVPVAGFDGDPRAISYVIEDAGGNLLPAVPVRISFAPEAQDDESLGNIAGDEVAIDVTENDLTSDIDPTSLAIVGADPNGDLFVRDEGTWSIDRETYEITFTPEPSFAGDPTPISYTVADDVGNRAPAAELVVDYLPVIRDDSSGGHPAGAIITIDVLANDPSNDLDATTVAIDHPDYNVVTRSLSVPGEGTWSVDAVTGAITVIPQPGFRGEPAPISYTVSDDDENVARSAELAIGHHPLPVAVADESFDNELEATVTVDVLANDLSDRLEPDSVRILGADPLTGELVVSSEGTWSVDAETGAISFNPKIRFEENPTPVEYTATDELGVSIDPTLVTIRYLGVVPESLAFAAPSEIDWPTFFLYGAVTAVLLGLSAWLVVSGRRPEPVPSKVLSVRSPYRS